MNTSSWQRPTYEVLAVRYGALPSTRSDLYAYYQSYGEPEAALQLDYFFWVARGGDRTVLVDTGFDAEVGRRRGRIVSCDPVEALHRLDIDPSEVTDVVLTHFHYDHIGNVRHFPRARLVASGREFDFWTGRHGRKPAAAVAIEDAELQLLEQARKEERLVLIGEDKPEVCVVPGMEWIDLSGHTPGMLGVSIDAGDHQVALASDAAHFYEEYERDMPFYLFTDLEGMYTGFEKLRELDASQNTVVVAGHDPRVMNRFPAVSPDLTGLAVRL